MARLPACSSSPPESPSHYIYDTYSIASPIGSHTKVHHEGRPGHEKHIGLSRMVASFAPQDSVIAASARISPSDVSDAARRRPEERRVERPKAETPPG